MRRTSMKILGLAILLASMFIYLPGQKKPPGGGQDCFDFVTYGGFLLGTGDGGGRVNFGGNAGFKNGDRVPLMAHVNVKDHFSGRHIKINSAECYGGGSGRFADPEGKCRRFTGSGTSTINNVTTAVGYECEVCDFGEPGNAPKGTDKFRIHLSDGYTAEGTLEGGNTQLHKECPQPPPPCPPVPF